MRSAPGGSAAPGWGSISARGDAMSKKRKSEDAPERAISKQQLVALVKEGMATKSKTSEIAGKFGKRVKSAVDDANLDGKAFQFCLGVVRMEAMRQQAFLRNVEYYLDLLREEGLIRESQGELPLDGDGDDDAAHETEDEAPLDAAEAEQVETNVTRLQRNIKKKPDEPAKGDAPSAADQQPSGVTLQ